EQIRRDDVFEQLIVNVSVSDLLSRGVDCHRARQSQESRPNSLRHQRCCWNMKAVGGPDFFEEQTVARHRIVNARSGKNKAVVATERGNHDRSRHAHRTGTTENGIHHGHSDPILRRVLDFRKWQYSHISKIGQQIENDDDAATYDQRAHKILSRVAYFTADKREICPGGLREERAHHRFSKQQRERKSTNECETGLGALWTPPVGPRIPPART